MVTVITLQTLLQYVALLIFFLWWLYWRITERQTQQEKPKQTAEHALISHAHAVKVLIPLAEALLVIQLLGIDLLPMSAPAWVLFGLQLSGLLFIILGVFMGVAARRTLGANWTHAYG